MRDMVRRYDLRRLRTRQDFVHVLGLTDGVLEHILAFEPPADPPDASPNARVISIPAFFKHRIPKRNKARGHRVAWEPTYAKPAYKRLARIFGKFFEYGLPDFPHPATFGYLGGRNIRENARVHCGHRKLLVVDIEDFFGSIRRERLETLFLSLGFTAEAADLFSRFVTIDGAVAAGLPTSPVLSNAIFHPIDQALQALAADVGAVYSRYSDDLSFSSNEALPDVVAIHAVLADHDFRLAVEKTRRSTIGQGHFVTGLSVSDPNQPHVARQKKQRLRQELHYAHKFGLQDHLMYIGAKDADEIQNQVNRIDGMVKFVAFHEPALSGALKPQWAGILGDAGLRPSFEPRQQSRDPFWICIDEAEFRSPNGPVLALGISASQHHDQVERKAADVLQDALGDLFEAGDAEALEKKGLHFADATQDLRLRFVKALEALPFEGYVVMGALDRPEEYEATYLRLLNAVIRRRLMAAESELAILILERNDKVAENKVRDLIASAMETLRVENNRRPKAAGVKFVNKPDLGVSVPDFLLGVLGLYLGSEAHAPGKPEPRDRLLFERIRDKYRLILNVDDWTEYSRRHPIMPWADRRD